MCCNIVRFFRPIVCSYGNTFVNGHGKYSWKSVVSDMLCLVTFFNTSSSKSWQQLCKAMFELTKKHHALIFCVLACQTTTWLSCFGFLWARQTLNLFLSCTPRTFFQTLMPIWKVRIQFYHFLNFERDLTNFLMTVLTIESSLVLQGDSCIFSGVFYSFEWQRHTSPDQGEAQIFQNLNR